MFKITNFILSFLITIISLGIFQISAISLATNTENIDRQAEQLYRENKYQEAIELLDKAVEQYEEAEDLIGSAIAYRNLALVYQKLGKWSAAKNNIASAENSINSLKDKTVKEQLLAQILEVRGQIELSLGQSQSALATWKETESLYEAQNNITGYTQTKIYQAAALQALGLYSKAIKTLTEIENKLAVKSDNQIKVRALVSLGNVLTRIGKYTEANDILESNLAIANKLKDDSLEAEILLNLANNARLQSDTEKALEYYQQALNLSSDANFKIRVRSDRLGVFVDRENLTLAEAEVVKIERLLTQLPSQQTTVQSKVGLARYLIALEAKPGRIITTLVEAIEQARSLQLTRIEAEALGVLGNLYERNQQWSEAEKITKQALLKAQNVNAKELIYQWQWQLGRIFKALDNKEQAVIAYTQATDNLQALRSDLVAISSDVRYSFREKIEPVYRELAALLLQPGASQTDLDRARQIIESLQVAELDNFFRDACLDTQPVELETIDPDAAIFYTIVLDNRLEVIAAIPNSPLQHYSNELPPSEIEIVVTSANSQISNPRRLDLQLLQQVYDWTIRPVEANLAASNVDTLVFIPDGILRNLPPATLHDGRQYLIEKYATAIAPSLQLVQLQDRETERQEVLLAGLSEPRQGFSRLPGVRQEINQIEPLFTSEVLLNNSFTELNFNRSANETPFRIVHLATHGQFSSNAEDTFILTWDDRINIDELNNFIRGDSKQLRPVDLLVLSACETATGDRNSTLGLAGIAVRGGARSTLASLWSVSDRATVELMTAFYREIAKGNITKAEALRRAQVEMLKSDRYSHPFFWSAFILVGNWR